MTSTIIRCIFIAVVAYILGNISPARILGKIYKVDITKEGSGNPGTTNVIRTLGLKAGIVTLLIDVLKAFIAVKFGLAFAWMAGGMTAFAAVVIGHCYPALYKFKGGKGVAATLGAAFALNFFSAMMAFAVAVIVLAISKRMSVGSLAAAVAYPILVLIYGKEYFIFSLFVAAFLILTHIPNIKRLMAGEEAPLSIGDKLKKN